MISNGMGYSNQYQYGYQNGSMNGGSSGPVMGNQFDQGGFGGFGGGQADQFSASGQRPNLQTLFQGADTNGDGNISLQEFQAFTPTLPNGQQAPNLTAQQKEMRFASLDSNGDGQLSQTELANPQPPQMGGFGGQGGFGGPDGFGQGGFGGQFGQGGMNDQGGMNGFDPQKMQAMRQIGQELKQDGITRQDIHQQVQSDDQTDGGTPGPQAFQQAVGELANQSGDQTLINNVTNFQNQYGANAASTTGTTSTTGTGTADDSSLMTSMTNLMTQMQQLLSTYGANSSTGSY